MCISKFDTDKRANTDVPFAIATERRTLDETASDVTEQRALYAEFVRADEDENRVENHCRSNASRYYQKVQRLEKVRQRCRHARRVFERRRLEEKRIRNAIHQELCRQPNRRQPQQVGRIAAYWIFRIWK